MRIQSVQDFFSSNPNCEQVVQCMFGLNKLEFTVYCSLLYLGEADVSDLIEYTGRDDRIMINRALQKLMDENLCTRQKESNPGKRGYKYVYQPKSLVELKAEIQNKVEDWYKNALAQIDQMEANFKLKHE